MSFLDIFKSSKSMPSYPLPKAMENAINDNNPYRKKYREQGSDNAIYLLYCDFSSTYRWIQDSTKPNSYFDNYIKSMQILSELTTYKRLKYFKSPSPAQQITDLRLNYSENTMRFIDRYWEFTVENAKKLKTEKGRQNRLNKFFDCLLNDYLTYLTEENINHVNSFKSKDIFETVQKIKQKVNCGKYDVSTIDNIRAIPNKDFDVMRLLQKAATAHKRNGDLDLAVECLKKSNSISDNLPEYSVHSAKLTPKEYLRVIKYRELIGDPELLKREKQVILKAHPEFFDKRISNKKHIDETLIRCSEFNNDLIEIFSNTTCPVCSKYDKKIYSISGKSLIYPKLPDEIKNQTQNCKNCFITASIFFDGIN